MGKISETRFLSNAENMLEAAEKTLVQCHIRDGGGTEPSPCPLRPLHFSLHPLEISQCMKAHTLHKHSLYSANDFHFRLKENLNALFITSAFTPCCSDHGSYFF